MNNDELIRALHRKEMQLFELPINKRLLQHMKSNGRVSSSGDVIAYSPTNGLPEITFDARNRPFRFDGDQRVLTPFIAPYHTQSRRRLERDAKYYIGVEIEKSSFEVNALCTADVLHAATGWVKEFDNSVTRGGYELVSPRMALSKARKHIEEFYALAPELIDAESDRSCGFHVHLSGPGVIEGLVAWAPLLYAMYPYRLSNHYCHVKAGQTSGEKYSGIRVIEGSRNHVELRMFPGCKNYEQLQWRVELVRIIVKNIGASEKDVYRMLIKPSALNTHVRKVYNKRYPFLLERFKLFCNAFNRTSFKTSMTIEDMVAELGIKGPAKKDLLMEVYRGSNPSSSYHAYAKKTIQDMVVLDAKKKAHSMFDSTPTQPTPPDSEESGLLSAMIRDADAMSYSIRQTSRAAHRVQISNTESAPLDWSSFQGSVPPPTTPTEQSNTPF